MRWHLVLQHCSVKQQPQQLVDRRRSALSRSSSLVPARAQGSTSSRGCWWQGVAAQPAQAGVALPQGSQHAAPAAQDVVLLPPSMAAVRQRMTWLHIGARWPCQRRQPVLRQQSSIRSLEGSNRLTYDPTSWRCRHDAGPGKQTIHACLFQYQS